MIDAVDLFCGAGGLTAGMRAAGIAVRAGYDIERQCEFAYTKNNGAAFVAKDVTSLGAGELQAWYRPGRYRLLAGCAPCQPFSTYNQGKDTRNDRKWPLLYAFRRLIEETQSLACERKATRSGRAVFTASTMVCRSSVVGTSCWRRSWDPLRS